MCTILTIDVSFFQSNRKSVLDRIKSDALYNSDGWSLVCIDSLEPENNIQVQSMNLAAVLKALDLFTDTCSEYSRIFLHARAATTRYVGLAYCHGFTDLGGRIFMHNGIIANPEHATVDSFNILAAPAGDELAWFAARGDTYANVFIIDTETETYTVLRLVTGQLHTDGQGNFSSHPFASIIQPVAHNTSQDFDMYAPVSIGTTSPWHGGSGNFEDSYVGQWDSYYSKKYK